LEIVNKGVPNHQLGESMKDFNGHYGREINERLKKVQKHEAYFNTLDYRREKIDQVWTSLKPQLSKNWDSKWFDRSLSLRNEKLRLQVKITMSNEVFVDRKVGKYDFKSDRYLCKTIEEAVVKLEQILTPYFFAVSALNTPQPVLVA
jgi:hypothetical protein